MEQSNAFSDELRTFVERHVTSLADLEALLALQRVGGGGLTPEDLAGKLCSNNEAEARRLARFADVALVSARPEGAKTRYALTTTDPNIAALISELGDIYRGRRVSLSSLIYANPIHTVKIGTERATRTGS